MIWTPSDGNRSPERQHHGIMGFQAESARFYANDRRRQKKAQLGILDEDVDRLTIATSHPKIRNIWKYFTKDD
jgi:hypothetical protein